MLQRGISQEQVESVLVSPDRVDHDDSNDSMRFEKDFDSMMLKVWVVADPWPPVDKVVVKTTAARHLGSLKIPAKATGRLIGRGGATIKSIQAATRARVEVKNDGVVHIRADDRASVEMARRMIYEITLNGTKRPR